MQSADLLNTLLTYELECFNGVLYYDGMTRKKLAHFSKIRDACNPSADGLPF